MDEDDDRQDDDEGGDGEKDGQAEERQFERSWIAPEIVADCGYTWTPIAALSALSPIEKSGCDVPDSAMDQTNHEQQDGAEADAVEPVHEPTVAWDDIA